MYLTLLLTIFSLDLDPRLLWGISVNPVTYSPSLSATDSELEAVTLETDSVAFVEGLSDTTAQVDVEEEDGEKAQRHNGFSVAPPPSAPETSYEAQLPLLRKPKLTSSSMPLDMRRPISLLRAVLLYPLAADACSNLWSSFHQMSYVYIVMHWSVIQTSWTIEFNFWGISLSLSLTQTHAVHTLSLLVYCNTLCVFSGYILYWFGFCPWQQCHRNEIVQTPYSETFLLPHLKELTAPQVIVSIYLKSQVMLFGN